MCPSRHKKNVSGGAYFAEKCPYKGTVPDEKCFRRDTFRIEVPLLGAIYLIKGVPGGAHFAELPLLGH